MTGYVEFERLMPMVLQDLFNEGVEESSFNKNRALYAIKDAYIQFVKRSHIIRRTLVIDAQAYVQEYPLFKQDGYVINKIYSVMVGCQCYSPGSFCVCQCCDYTYNYQDGFLTLCPTPQCDGEAIQVCASVFPDSMECQMEEIVFERYGREIASGSVYRLLSKSASGPFQVEYDAGIDRASHEAAKSWGINNLRGSRTKWVRR